MALDLEQVFSTLLTQSPLAGAGIYVAHLFMKKHEEAMGKLISTFEAEVKACEERYRMVWDELMRLKNEMGGR